MDDRLAHNLRCIDEGLAAIELTPDRRIPTGMQLYVNTEHAVLSLSAFSAEDGSWIVVFGSHPARVPAERRSAVADAMARINYQQVIGNFDLDAADGEMRYRIGHATDMTELTSEVVSRLVGYMLYTWRRFHNALMAVAYGGRSPEDAVSEALAIESEDGDSVSATETPVNVDAILTDMGLAGPIGSLPGEQPGACTTQSPDTFDRETIDMSRELTSKHAEAVAPFPNAYVVPGTRLIAGEYPGAKDLTEARAKVRALLDAGVTRVIDLTEPGELTPFAELLAREATARGVTATYHSRPIRDVDVCTPDQMRIILDEIDAALAGGETVYVHCWGGAGRTGTVVGCWLVRHGHTGADALAEVQRLFETMSPGKVKRHPEGSPQTTGQRRMVQGWAGVDRVRTEPEPRRDC